MRCNPQDCSASIDKCIPIHSSAHAFRITTDAVSPTNRVVLGRSFQSWALALFYPLGCGKEKACSFLVETYHDGRLRSRLLQKDQSANTISRVMK